MQRDNAGQHDGGFVKGERIAGIKANARDCRSSAAVNTTQSQRGAPRPAASNDSR